MMLAPIVIFAFNRPDMLRNLVASLRNNPLYNESDKYVFIDGCRNESDKDKVSETVRVASEITENVAVSEKNKGLGTSVISGVSEIINKYGRAIVLEDDLFCAPGFLIYMNQALDFYENDERVISVCGYGLKIRRPKNYSSNVYFSDRSSSWGWATWKDRWDTIDWNVSDWESIKNDKYMQKAFNHGGSDMYSMLKAYMEGRNKSWAIRFCYSQFRQGKFSVHPFESLVENDGFGVQATNCRQKYSRFKVNLDLKNYGVTAEAYLNGKESNDIWLMHEKISVDNRILRQLHSYHSFIKRIYSKIRKIINI